MSSPAAHDRRRRRRRRLHAPSRRRDSAQLAAPTDRADFHLDSGSAGSAPLHAAGRLDGICCARRRLSSIRPWACRYRSIARHCLRSMLTAARAHTHKHFLASLAQPIWPRVPSYHLSEQASERAGERLRARTTNRPFSRSPAEPSACVRVRVSERACARSSQVTTGRFRPGRF